MVFPSLHLQQLQSSLSSRSGEVGGLVSDVQLFISERAPDLAPEQSRQLLGQLQRLQSAYHRASGRAQARADALAAQRGREEEERRRREEEEEDRERRSANEREVWKEMNGMLLLALQVVFQLLSDHHILSTNPHPTYI